MALQKYWRGSWPLCHRIFQHADAVNLDPHHIARLQVLRRLKTNAHAHWRAGGDHVTGIERDARAQGLDQGRDVSESNGSLLEVAEGIWSILEIAESNWSLLEIAEGILSLLEFTKVLTEVYWRLLRGSLVYWSLHMGKICLVFVKKTSYLDLLN